MKPPELRVGDAIPAWSRTTESEHWNRFAAVNDEFVPMHMDDEGGRKAGNPAGAFGMGNLRYSYMLNALRDWLGDELEIRSLECQFRSINQRKDTLTVLGNITALEKHEHDSVLHLDLDVINQRGESTSPAHAVVVVPTESRSRFFRARSSPGSSSPSTSSRTRSTRP